METSKANHLPHHKTKMAHHTIVPLCWAIIFIGGTLTAKTTATCPCQDPLPPPPPVLLTPPPLPSSTCPPPPPALPFPFPSTPPPPPSEIISPMFPPPPPTPTMPLPFPSTPPPPPSEIISPMFPPPPPAPTLPITFPPPSPPEIISPMFPPPPPPPTLPIAFPPPPPPETIPPIFPPPPPPQAVVPGPTSRPIKGGYWLSWLADKFPAATIPTSYFTHVFYSFVVIDPTSNQLLITLTDSQMMKDFTDTLHTQKQPALAFLSIGGANSNPDTFSNMASNTATRAIFIKSTIDVARKYGLDGLDLNWEFPGTPEDMTNLAMLFKDWREALETESQTSGRPRILLSAAVYFAPSFFLFHPARTYPVAALNNFVDFVSPMCFNYHGNWDTSVTGAHALLYDKTSRISTSFGIASWIQAGMPAEKIVMGLPLYGWTWQLKDPKVNGIGAPAVGEGPGDNGTMTYGEIVDFNAANNAQEVYDGETVSTYSYSGTTWIGYDGRQSITEKTKFARSQGLGGYFLWGLGYDDKNAALSIAAATVWDS